VGNHHKEGEMVEGSLFERLGGVDALTAVARAFVDRGGKDDRINQKFARTDLDRLIKGFVDQLCAAIGGPCTYTGRSLTQAHANTGVTNGEFDAFMDLVATLDDFKVGKAEQDQSLGLLTPLRGEIVEVDSSQVGTPLPAGRRRGAYRDRQSMNWAFELWPYEDVSEHADAILAKLRRGAMPCDGCRPGIGSTSSSNGGAMGRVRAASRQLVGSKP
jgi:hemoglobin